MYFVSVVLLAACGDATGPSPIPDLSVPEDRLPRPGVAVCYFNCDCGPTSASAPPDTSAPTLESLPKLVNGAYISSLVAERYPRDLAGRFGGTTRINLIITEKGDPEHVWMCESSGYGALDRLAVNVGTALKFIPARYEGQDVRILATMPVTFIP
jgi:TonB family protein